MSSVAVARDGVGGGDEEGGLVDIKFYSFTSSSWNTKLPSVTVASSLSPSFYV